MLDILVYLFEHFEELGNGEQQTIQLDAAPLSESLIEAGFEREEIDAGLVGFADQHAVVFALVPGLEIDPALGVAPTDSLLTPPP